jgi:hypothetical protein
VRWETTLAALAVVVAIIVSLWWSRRPEPSYARSAAVGAAWGLSLLAAPALLPVFVILSCWWAVSIGLARRPSSLPRLAALVLAAVAVLAPWTIRNYYALGGLMFVRSNFGIEFSVSNHDTAYVLARDNSLIGFPQNYFHEHHPWTNRAQAQRVQQIGEVAYNRERLAETLAWCRTHPKRFFQLTAGRFWYFWAMPSINQRYKNLLLQPITVLGLVGLVIVWRRDPQAGGVFWSLLLGYPLVYYLVQTDSRYRYPIDWSLLFLAAYAIGELGSRVGIEDRDRESGITSAPML